MIENEFAPYDLALAMKELGFDESTLFTYYRKKIGYIKNSIKGGTPPNLPFPQYVPAPTYSQAFRWFRENYNWINPTRQLVFILDKTAQSDNPMSYEEAEFACLRKLIEIINQMKDEHK